MAYYHVRITLVDRRRSLNDELALDLSCEQLEQRFLAPRREGRAITMQGRTLGWDEIDRIHINQTEPSSAQLLPTIRAERRASPVIALGISDEWEVTNRGQDVTDKLITEPVGAEAPPPTSEATFFHVRLERGALRQAHEFNLRYDDVWRRFVVPWREGRPVTAEGKAFDPTEARLKIRTGPRLTTSQRSLGQGWANAVEFAEEVTDKLLSTSSGRSSQPTGRAHGSSRRDARAVAVFHGRDDPARQAIFGFLRDLDLKPLGWGELVRATGTATPYTGDVVDVAFEIAQAVVVLFTPDDEARLHPQLCAADEPGHEQLLTTQPRANVILEAGMAMMSHPSQTIIVEIGRLRPISNLAGRNTVRITAGDVPGAINELASRLEAAQCPINRNSRDWLGAERFQNLDALRRHAQEASPGADDSLPSALSSTEDETTDELVLELRAAAGRAGVRLDQPNDQHLATFLREQREAFYSATLAAIPTPKLLQQEAKRLIIELERADVIARGRKPMGGGHGWLLKR
ncbi:MAG: nucleotide-binding protein [Solirubrobacterales bacterium]|nr:nucleotide-binding protein [Solirubrobacterales bacterium]